VARQRKRLLILGAGGHGKVVADAARTAGFEIVGFADADVRLMGHSAEPGGAKVVFSQADLEVQISRLSMPPEADVLAIAIGNNAVRASFLERVTADWLPPIIHASAVVSPSARVGHGTVVFARAVIQPDAVIGPGCIINTGAIIEHDNHLGSGVHVSPGAVLSGNVTVGDRSWIGAGAVVIQGITIGADVIVGAGTVVIRDLPAGSKAVGNPARQIGNR
jgi:sugar O-acyltransferase (sialic acid O-acetyltransferase NeuD family)